MFKVEKHDYHVFRPRTTRIYGPKSRIFLKKTAIFSPAGLCSSSALFEENPAFWAIYAGSTGSKYMVVIFFDCEQLIHPPNNSYMPNICEYMRYICDFLKICEKQGPRSEGQKSDRFSIKKNICPWGRGGDGKKKILPTPRVKTRSSTNFLRQAFGRTKKYFLNYPQMYLKKLLFGRISPGFTLFF